MVKLIWSDIRWLIFNFRLVIYLSYDLILKNWLVLFCIRIVLNFNMFLINKIL